ncbi:MAG: metallophosphoesterase [Anaerolineae bacterium]
MKINRRGFLKAFGQAMLGGALTTAGGCAYGLQVEPEWLTIEQIQLPIRGLKAALEGFKIVHLSDFHLYPHTKIELIQQAIELANSLKPDLAVFTGDYVLETAGSIFELAPVLATLNPRYGHWAILGNHDLWTDAAMVRAGLEKAGIPVLVNKGVPIQVGRERMYVAGIDDGWSGRPDLPAALANWPSDAPVILLAHEPDLADAFAPDERISLQLSGHSHGGQVRVPGLGAPILPYLGQKYDRGLHRVNQTWVYTNRGIGVINPPIRINCPPEITEIILVSQ